MANLDKLMAFRVSGEERQAFEILVEREDFEQPSQALRYLLRQALRSGRIRFPIRVYQEDQRV